MLRRALPGVVLHLDIKNELGRVIIVAHSLANPLARAVDGKTLAVQEEADLPHQE